MLNVRKSTPCDFFLAFSQEMFGFPSLTSLLYPLTSWAQKWQWQDQVDTQFGKRHHVLLIYPFPCFVLKSIQLTTNNARPSNGRNDIEELMKAFFLCKRQSLLVYILQTRYRQNALVNILNVDSGCAKKNCLSHQPSLVLENL